MATNENKNSFMRIKNIRSNSCHIKIEEYEKAFQFNDNDGAGDDGKRTD